METNSLDAVSMKQVVVRRVDGLSVSAVFDILSVEEPLEIKIDYGTGEARTKKNISVTMRTPGNDPELAAGFLFTEGIISSGADITHTQANNNTVMVELAEGCIPNLMQSDRNFYTTSSCGVCGKDAIQSIRTVNAFCHLNKPQLNLLAEVFFNLPGKLREAQRDFAASGGLHASGLFSLDGELILLREDVGRHNALDKLIGAVLLEEGLLPLNQHILLLSGRASFELIQKAAMAGISVVAAIGAPSSLAVELAEDFDMTLLGFLKGNRFNIYNAGKSVKIK